MPLVSPRDCFTEAYICGYAVGGFNVNSMEVVQAVTRAAQEEHSSVILQASSSAIRFAGMDYLVGMVKAAAAETGLPLVLHLDHGATLEACQECIEAGFTSVMIDGSHLPYEENVALTKQVVDYAHKRDVWVEAELGKLAGVEDEVSSEHSVYTDPDQAMEFIDRTGCDSLAVAVGTSHGAYKFKGDAKLDMDRLLKITNMRINYPLVLHGSSGVPQEAIAMANEFGAKIEGAKGMPDAMLRQAARMGVCKINIDTDIRLTMTAHIRKHMAENPSAFDPRGYMGAAREAVIELVRQKMRDVLGSSGSLP